MAPDVWGRRAAVRRHSWRKRVGTPAACQAVRHAVRQRRMAMPLRWKTALLHESELVPLRDRCGFGRFTWLISQVSSVAYVA